MSYSAGFRKRFPLNNAPEPPISRRGQRFRIGRPDGNSKASLVSTFRLGLMTTALTVSVFSFAFVPTPLREYVLRLGFAVAPRIVSVFSLFAIETCLVQILTVSGAQLDVLHHSIRMTAPALRVEAVEVGRTLVLRRPFAAPMATGNSGRVRDGERKAHSSRPFVTLAWQPRDLCRQPFGGGAGSGGGGCSSVGSVSDIAGSGSSEGIVSVVSAGDAVSSGGGAGSSTAGEGVPVWAADSSLFAPQPARSTEPNASAMSVLSIFITLPLVSLHTLE